VAGTPLYIAPERLRDASVNDPRSDLYSLGVMAFRMVTGEELYDGSSPFEIFQQCLNERPRRPSELAADLPPGLDALIMDCLAEAPADRVASATELIARLDALDGIEPWSQADARLWWKENAQRFGIEDPTRTHSAADVLAAAEG
jgi:serine/threonine protein kinase